MQTLLNFGIQMGTVVFIVVSMVAGNDVAFYRLFIFVLCIIISIKLFVP